MCIRSDGPTVPEYSPWNAGNDTGSSDALAERSPTVTRAARIAAEAWRIRRIASHPGDPRAPVS